MDKDEIALSQNDVLKRTHNPDIGGDEDDEGGVWGVSALEACAQDAQEYREMKRDRAISVRKTAYAIWVAQFNTEVTEAGDEVILQEWSEDEQNDWVDDVDGLEAGGIVGHDGSIELDQWSPDVPELDGPLEHYVADILAALPAPKYTTAFGESIANHVSDRQENSYQDTITEERRDVERDWTQAFRDVAERHPKLDASGLELKLSPKESDNPIATLDDGEIERMEQFMKGLNNGLGDVPVDAVLDVKQFLMTTMDLPEEVFVDGEVDVDESDPDLAGAVQEATGAAEADD